MSYLCELGTGQKIYLDNQGTQTTITTISGSLGQQQQSSSGFQTGAWVSPPQIFQTPNGVVVKVIASNGEHLIQVQGSSMSVMGGNIPLNASQQMQVTQVSQPSVQPMQPMQPMQPIQPMQPMQPMQPLKMGDMEMNINPMAMRMGNMEMQMGTPSESQSTRRFCSQCGAKVGSSDRFCASCGHQLQ